MRNLRGRPRSFIPLVSAAALGILALAVVRATTSDPSSNAATSLAEYVGAFCTAAYRSALPREAPFLSENASAMVKMMAGMEITPTGDIDRDFTEMMIPHHQGAIDMAQAELRHGHNEQLRRIAQEIIVTQQQEVAAMRLALGQPLLQSAAAPDQPADPVDHSRFPPR